MRGRLLVAGAAMVLGACVGPRLAGHDGARAFYHAADHYRVRHGVEDTASPSVRWERLNPTPRDPREDLSPLGLRLPQRDLDFRRDNGSEIFVRTVPLARGWDADPVPVLMQLGVRARRADGLPDLLGRDVELDRVSVVRQGEAIVDGERGYYLTVDAGAGGRLTLVGVRSLRRLAGVGPPLRALVVFVHRSSAAAHEDEQADFASLVRRVDLAPP